MCDYAVAARPVAAADRAGVRPTRDLRPRRLSAAGRFRPDCAHCPVQRLCLPSLLSGTEMPMLDFVVVSRRSIRRAQMLYHAGDACDALYAIHAGFFKTIVMSRNGDEQVTGLHMSGDIVGLDGVATRRHTCDAVALDQSEVCVVPLPNLLEQALHDEPLQRALCGILAREIERQQNVLRLVGSMGGLQRVATFLLDVSHRTEAHGYSPTEFELRLTRREIGSYLGMELETVSRIISRLERDGLIVVDRAHIRISDVEGLARASSTRPRQSHAVEA